MYIKRISNAGNSCGLSGFSLGYVWAWSGLEYKKNIRRFKFVPHVVNLSRPGF
jgi:hypothetical protein